MDEMLIRVLTRLLRVHDELGRCAFEDAAQRAIVAIALAAQREAERRAGVSRPRRKGTVLILNRYRALRPERGDPSKG